jgi:hypothetical protein
MALMPMFWGRSDMAAVVSGRVLRVSGEGGGGGMVVAEGVHTAG